MMDELNVVRSKIDKIDQNLLKLLAKRFALVSDIGEIKSQLGLFIYAPDREDRMIDYRRQEAVKLGLSPDLVEDILRRIMRESYCNESNKGFKTLCPSLRQIVIIGGKGQIGQFFCKMLTLSGYRVLILDKDDWGGHAELMLKDAGMVLISVPIHLVVDVVNKLPQLPHDCVVVDLSSIKKISLKSILDIHKGPVLGLHPMFSPDYGNMVKQVVVYCEGRYPEAYQWLLSQIKLWGAYVYPCDLIEHDQYMGLIQGLYHFVTFMFGYHLFKENVDVKKVLSFSSATFRLKLITVGRLFSKNPQLYADIIMASEDNIMLIKRYYRRLGRVITLLERNNKQEFMDQFKNIKNWFGMYSDLFLEDSHKILCQINDMKN